VYVDFILKMNVLLTACWRY